MIINLNTGFHNYLSLLIAKVTKEKVVLLYPEHTNRQGPEGYMAAQAIKKFVPSVEMFPLHDLDDMGEIRSDVRNLLDFIKRFNIPGDRIFTENPVLFSEIKRELEELHALRVDRAMQLWDERKFIVDLSEVSISAEELMELRGVEFFSAPEREIRRSEAPSSIKWFGGIAGWKMQWLRVVDWKGREYDERVRKSMGIGLFSLEFKNGLPHFVVWAPKMTKNYEPFMFAGLILCLEKLFPFSKMEILSHPDNEDVLFDHLDIGGYLNIRWRRYQTLEGSERMF